MIAKPSIEVREYLKASGSIAIYAMIGRGRAITFGASADPWSAAEQGKAELVGMFWILAGDDCGARAVEAAIEASQEHTPSSALFPSQAAQWALARVARDIENAPSERVIEIAERAVAIIDQKLAAMAAAGGMKRVHREYKAARAAGIEKRPWGTFRREYRLRMVRDVAQATAPRAKPCR